MPGARALSNVQVCAAEPPGEVGAIVWRMSFGYLVDVNECQEAWIRLVGAEGVQDEPAPQHVVITQVPVRGQIPNQGCAPQLSDLSFELFRAGLNLFDLP